MKKERIEIVKKVTIVRWQAGCGKKFTTKARAVKHEKNCKCWLNPKHKTCMTCKHGKFIMDSNGMEHEPQLLHQWHQWECFNNDFDYEKDFVHAKGDNTNSLCINCPKYELK